MGNENKESKIESYPRLYEPSSTEEMEAFNNIFVEKIKKFSESCPWNNRKEKK